MYRYNLVRVICQQFVAVSFNVYIYMLFVAVCCSVYINMLVCVICQQCVAVCCSIYIGAYCWS